MNQKLVIGFVAVAFVATGVFANGPLGQDPAPAVPAKDAFPEGCVSCHTKLAPDADHRLNVLLAKKSHAKLTVVTTVPKDCAKCHKAGTKMEGMNTLMHKVHYGRMEESEYNKLFQGACVNCHAMDPKTGAMSVKSGPKNW